MGGVSDRERLNRLLAQRRLSSQPTQPGRTHEEQQEEGGRFGFLGSAFNILGEVDKPISERLGIDAPDRVGFVLEELTRPTTWLAATGFAGAASRLQRSGNVATRAAGGMLAPVTGQGSSFPVRVAGEGALAVGARAGADLAHSTLPEDAGTLAQVGTALAGGLAGGLAGAAGARHALRPYITDPVILPKTATRGESVQPHPFAAEHFGLPDIEVGLSPAAEVRNALRAVLPFKTMKEDAIATPAELARKQGFDNVESVANTVNNKMREIIRPAFDIDPETGLIKSLANDRFSEGVTLSTLAARRPLFEGALNPAQRRALDQIQETLAPYRDFLQELYPNMGMRPDVMEGGFYIPRGDGTSELWEAPSYVTRGFKGTPGHAKMAVVDSPEQAIALGYRYIEPEEAISNMIRRTGRDATDAHVRNYLLTVKDPLTGQPVAQTWRDRLTADELKIEKLLNNVRSSTRAYRTRLAELEGAGVAHGREAGRTQTQFNRATERVIKATERLVARNFSETDVRAAIQDLADIAADGRALAGRVEHNRQQLQSARKALTQEERELIRAVEELTDLNANIDAMVSRSAHAPGRDGGQVIGPSSMDGDLKAQYLRATKMAARADAEVERLMGRVERMDRRVDDLIQRGEVMRNLTQAEREAEHQTRQILRHEIRQERAMAVAERELALLTRDQNRLMRAADGARNRVAATELRKAGTSIRLEELRSKLRDVQASWSDIKQQAMRTPHNQARIQRYDLDNYTFADEVAATINKMLDQEGRNIGRDAGWVNTIRALNNIYRGLKATMDMSFMGIQALLGGASDQRAYAEALRMTMKAMFGSGTDSQRALGMLLQGMDEKAAARGLPTSEVWSANGLRIGGTATEFELRAGFEKLGLNPRRWPGYRRADRAFGYAGDAMRRTWAEHLLESELARGRTVKQLVDSGELRQIAESVNRMTGWTGDRFAGSLGDMILFAPRFLQSRLETVAKAYQGMLPGATLEQRLARNALGKFVALGTTTTFAINWALNEAEITTGPGDFMGTDIRPLVNGRYNANFMRIRAFGRDWSIFGTWDSLLRAMVLTAQGQPHQALRGMSSGTVSIGWDLLSGRTFVGDPVRDTPEDFARYAFGAVLPFAFTDTFTNAPQHLTGALAGDVSGVAGAVGDVFGVKSSPMTPSEHRDDAARRMFGQNWVDLTGEQRNQLEAEHPEVFSRAEEHLETRAQRGDQWAMLQLRRTEIDRERASKELEALHAYMSGEITVHDFAESIEGIQREAAIRKQEVDEVLGEPRTREGEPHWEALSAYYETFNQAEVAPGIIDWELRQVLEDELMRSVAAGTYGDPATAKRFIDERRKAEHAPEVQWYFDAKDYIGTTDYYAIRDQSYERFRRTAEQAAGEPLPTYGSFIKAMNRAKQRGDRGLIRRLEMVELRVQRVTQQQRMRLRRRDSALDAALLNIGRVQSPARGRS